MKIGTVLREIRGVTSKDITVEQSGFCYDGAHYPNEDVISLKFYYVITRKKVNFRSAGTDYSAEFDIYVEPRAQPISLRTSQIKGWLDVNRSEDEAEPVVLLYRQLAQQTFRFRLARYLEQIEKRGYFHYDGKAFFKSGTVSDGSRKISLNTDRPLLKSPFEVFHPAPKTHNAWIKGLWARQDFVISTKFDSDVFFWLLDQFFGLRWGDSSGRV